MTDTLQSLRINSDRMLTAFNELAHSRGLDATGDGGVHRPTFSEAHLAARNGYREQIEKAGLEFRTDGAGNHSAVLPASVITSSQHLHLMHTCLICFSNGRRGRRLSILVAGRHS